jgi:tetratricopeptide (TPR) repeat protein
MQLQMKSLSRVEIMLLLILVIGLSGVVSLAHWIDSHRPPIESKVEEEKLYLSAAMVDRLSLGFNGLAADWYWMRSLQYVGRKILSLPENVQLDNLSDLNLSLLAPLLDATTTLDPQFMEPYQYAAVVLPAINTDEAIRIINKGIASNPTEWRLYHHLGYIYWQQKDFNAAGEAYSHGASLSGAPAWMQVMKARMADEGGSRATAREIYTRMYEAADDGEVKEMARRRLLQLDAFEQMDGLRRVMETYKVRAGRCPASWQELQNAFRILRVKVDSSGAPLDPAGTAYLLVKDKCDLNIDRQSEVPSK